MIDKISRNIDFYIEVAADALKNLEGMVAGDDFTYEYLRIRAVLTVLLEPNTGYEGPEREAIIAIEKRARELMSAHEARL